MLAFAFISLSLSVAQYFINILYCLVFYRINQFAQVTDSVTGDVTIVQMFIFRHYGSYVVPETELIHVLPGSRLSLQNHIRCVCTPILRIHESMKAKYCNNE